MKVENYHRAVILWLGSIFFIVLTIVFVGGVTRLTHSGLSMVDWNPILGILPPLNEHEWLLKFERYKQFPEYILINQDMTLRAFKSIFFWEYFHRILGRMVGIIFLLPWLYFLFSRKITKAFAFKIFSVFVLGGLQGLMGWYMVKSGLVNNPYVSHYRLAAHLTLALALLSLLFWVISNLKDEGKAIIPYNDTIPSWLKNMLLGIFTLVCLQILYGAFTAGLKAGFFYNTFPTMNGEWFPSEFFELLPTWLNFFENAIAVQFIHRTLGWLCFFSITFLWISVRRYSFTLNLLRKVDYLLLGIIVQFLLGVFTLLKGVPVALGSLHQVWACVVLLLVLSVMRHMMKCRPANQ